MSKYFLEIVLISSNNVNVVPNVYKPCMLIK